MPVSRENTLCYILETRRELVEHEVKLAVTRASAIRRGSGVVGVVGVEAVSSQPSSHKLHWCSRHPGGFLHVITLQKYETPAQRVSNNITR